MNIIWGKVWADLWSNKVRTILAVLSIAAGVFAIGAIFGMVDQLMSGMDEAHQAVFPSHINMYLSEEIDRDMADSLERIDGVEAVELMNSVTVRYKNRPEDEWERAQMIMREDYGNQTYDVVQLKEGQWPTKDDIAIERLSGQYYGIGIGDELLFELEGTDRRMQIVGKIRHPFVPPPQFGGDAVFFASAEGMERFGVEEGEYSQLLARVEPWTHGRTHVQCPQCPHSLELAKSVASEMKDRLAKEDVDVAVTFYQDPEKHWGRVFVEGITVVMQVLAVVSLFTSVILVLNTLRALITQQTNQIGIIKAIGGNTATILKTYLAEVLAYGSLALFISLPLGVAVAFGLTRWFLNLFNIDYGTFQFSTRALVFQAIAAIAAPLIAALWPVAQGATITVREAIASYGLGGTFGSSWIDRAVDKVGQRLLPSHYALALSNTFRRKGRLALTQLVLVAAGSMFLIVMSLSLSLTLTLENEFERRDYDVALYFDGRERIDRLLTMAESVGGVEKAEVWFNQPAAVLREGQRASEAGLGAYIEGVPGDSVYRPLIVAGRWLQPEDRDSRVIVMNRETADDNDIEVGDVVTLDLGVLGEDEWQVVGLYQIIFSGGFSSDSIYAPQQAVFRATKKVNEASQLYVRTRRHTEEYVGAVTDQLKGLYKARNMDISYTRATYEDRRDAGNQFNIAIYMLLALAVIMALVGGIGLMSSLSISVVERTREIGVMRAIGAVSGRLMGMFVMEGVLQGLLSWALAVPISLVVSQPMANILGQTMFGANLDFAYSFGAVFAWLAIVLMVSVLASIVPARSATVISVRESLAYE
jgi:putative ABC transport system permease protein